MISFDHSFLNLDKVLREFYLGNSGVHSLVEGEVVGFVIAQNLDVESVMPRKEDLQRGFPELLEL